MIGFNPRPRVGGDVSVGGAVTASTVFQSTPPRRGRLALCDWSPFRRLVSIHAPA